MRRRDFIALVGGSVTVLPTAAFAQQPAKPVVGFLASASAGPFAPMVAAFEDGLNQIGYVDGRNVTVEHHWAEGDYDRLPWFAADLVNRKVAAIVSAGTPAAMAAKGTTTTIPIVFFSGVDPVRVGIVGSLDRPAGNITGVANLTNGLITKQIELMHQVLPSATLIAVLVNKGNPNYIQEISETREAQASLGIKTTILQASAMRDLNTAFAKALELQAGALVIGTDSYFDSERREIAALAMRNGLPTMHQLREFVAAGGLMSYGANFVDAYRLVGLYTGRVLKGEKPADLPIQVSTKFQLVVNLKAAETLGVTIPGSLLSRANEVIE
jgi:putative ABC transport system substrate-binding protein